MTDRSPIVDEVLEQPLEEIKGIAIEKLAHATDGLVRWADRVRDADAPYRFKWAVDTLRDFNVAASTYIMSGLGRAGGLTIVLTETDRDAGIEWIRSLEDGRGGFQDPALLACKPWGWKKRERVGRPPGLTKKR